jgi:hypothetical protein
MLRRGNSVIFAMAFFGYFNHTDSNSLRTGKNYQIGRFYTSRICGGLHNSGKTKRTTVENYVENVNKCPYSLF